MQRYTWLLKQADWRQSMLLRGAGGAALGGVTGLAGGELLARGLDKDPEARAKYRERGALLGAALGGSLGARSGHNAQVGTLKKDLHESHLNAQDYKTQLLDRIADLDDLGQRYDQAILDRVNLGRKHLQLGEKLKAEAAAHNTLRATSQRELQEAHEGRAQVEAKLHKLLEEQREAKQFKQLSREFALDTALPQGIADARGGVHTYNKVLRQQATARTKDPPGGGPVPAHEWERAVHEARADVNAAYKDRGDPFLGHSSIYNQPEQLSLLDREPSQLTLPGVSRFPQPRGWRD